MDWLVTAAAHARAAGERLGALNRVASRDVTANLRLCLLSRSHCGGMFGLGWGAEQWPAHRSDSHPLRTLRLTHYRRPRLRAI